MPTRKQVVDLCKSLRMEAGFTQTQLAELFDLPDKNRIKNIEGGRVRLREAEIELYSSRFKLDKKLFIESTPKDRIGYNVANALRRCSIGQKRSSSDIANGTGITVSRVDHLRALRMDNSGKPGAYATEEEALALARYFGVEEDVFLANAETVAIKGPRKAKELPDKVKETIMETNTAFKEETTHSVEYVDTLKNQIKELREENHRLEGLRKEAQKEKDDIQKKLDQMRERTDESGKIKGLTEELDHYKTILLAVLIEDYKQNHRL